MVTVDLRFIEVKVEQIPFSSVGDANTSNTNQGARGNSLIELLATLPLTIWIVPQLQF